VEPNFLNFCQVFLFKEENDKQIDKDLVRA